MTRVRRGYVDDIDVGGGKNVLIAAAAFGSDLRGYRSGSNHYLVAVSVDERGEVTSYPESGPAVGISGHAFVPDAVEFTGPESGQRDIERALAMLVEDQRDALLLVVLEGLSYREVAEVQAVPIGTVMSRLARARAQIKAYLDGERPALRRVK